MMKAANYNQADPKWGDVVFATTPDGEQMTIRRWGCLGTAICNALANHAIEITPSAFFAKGITVGAFDSLGYFDNTKIPTMFPSVLNYERSNTTNIPNGRVQPDAAISKIKSLIDAGQPVIAWVDNVKKDGEPDHWVTLVDHKDGDFLLHNPDGGLPQWFKARYGDPMTKLYGYLALIGPPVAFPDHSTPSDKKRGQAMFKAAQVYQGKNVKTYAKEILMDLV